MQPRKAPTITMTDIVFPEDTNPNGTMFGGRVMAMMDKAAVIAAVRFFRTYYVTISSDGIQFLAPIRQGDIVEVSAKVAFVGRTSLIVKVEVNREHFVEGSVERCTEGWFAMAARGRDNVAAELPPLLVETEEERQLEEQARAFRERSRSQKVGRG